RFCATPVMRLFFGTRSVLRPSMGRAGASDRAAWLSRRSFPAGDAAIRTDRFARDRMTLTRVLLCAAMLIAIAGDASAQAIDFPNRPVKIVVPFAAGGPTDVVARILADLLSARWNAQSVVIENRPGAGTILATAAVAKSPPDGYTMLIGTNSILINPAIGQK